MLVALVVLYYFVIFFSYTIAWYSSVLVNALPTNINLAQQNISIGDLLCSISDDLCIEALEPFVQSIPAPNINITLSAWIHTSIEWILVGPLIGTPLICLLNIWLLAKDVKTHLRQIYKGECEFVLKASSLSNAWIAGQSFHFGG